MISFTTTDRHESKIKQRKNQMNNISEFRKSQNELYLKYSLEDTKVVVLSNRNAKKITKFFLQAILFLSSVELQGALRGILCALKENPKAPCAFLPHTVAP